MRQRFLPAAWSGCVTPTRRSKPDVPEGCARLLTTPFRLP